MAEEEILYQGQPSVVGSLGRFLICIFTLGLGYLWFWIRTRHIKYLITSQRVVVERGIFNRIIDTIELYRVDDIELTKPFSQRLFGTGNITDTFTLNFPVRLRGVATHYCSSKQRLHPAHHWTRRRYPAKL